MSRERRPLFRVEEPLAEPGRYGCPMLTRTRTSQSGDANRPVMRCSLGWALHNERDVERCRTTDTLIDCWKVHPERAPVVSLTAEAEAVEAAGD